MYKLERNSVEVYTKMVLGKLQYMYFGDKMRVLLNCKKYLIDVNAMLVLLKACCVCLFLIGSCVCSCEGLH